MHTHRGTTETTLNNYRLPLLDLLATLGEQPAQYNAKGLRDFILAWARGRSVEQAKSLVTPVRMFLRFLIATGRCTPGLEHAIPTIARWRLASLPKYLSPEAVEQVVASCDLTTPIGVRDHAILLLLARLGLRAGDVAALTLRDLDWHEGTVQAVAKADGKTASHSPKKSVTRSCTISLPAPSCTTTLFFSPLPHPSRACRTKPSARLRPRRSGGRVSTPRGMAHMYCGIRPPPRCSARAFPCWRSARCCVMRPWRQPSGDAKVDFPLLEQVVRPWPEDPSC